MHAVWQTELASAFSHPLEFLAHLGLSADAFPGLLEASADFPFRVTRAYAERIEKGNPQDPLLLQVLPLAAERLTMPGFGLDPVGDLGAVAGPGLLHKYAGRVLLISTGACAIHCRYCFRRNFPYEDLQLSKSRLDTALTAIRQDTGIHEVILSGGDPLVLGDDRLLQLIQSIAAIPHVRRLRLHSRIPVVLPSRFDEGLTSLLSSTRLQVVMVIHANHANELDEQVRQTLRGLSDGRITVLNQAVLLRGINDDARCLIDLSERLLECGTLPYYLHLLDRAHGTAHFEVSEARARELMGHLRDHLPGYLVPRLVREQAGARSKLPVD